MPIVIKLNRVMAARGISSTELARRIGTSTVNLSNIKTGKVRGVRFTTLEAICRELRCTPGDILDYVPSESDEDADSL